MLTIKIDVPNGDHTLASKIHRAVMEAIEEGSSTHAMAYHQMGEQGMHVKHHRLGVMYTARVSQED